MSDDFVAKNRAKNTVKKRCFWTQNLSYPQVFKVIHCF